MQDTPVRTTGSEPCVLCIGLAMPSLFLRRSYPDSSVFQGEYPCQSSAAPVRRSSYSLSSRLTLSRRSRSFRASSSRLAFSLASFRASLMNPRGIMNMDMTAIYSHRMTCKMSPLPYRNRLTCQLMAVAAITTPTKRTIRTFVLTCIAANQSRSNQDQERLITHFTTKTSRVNRGI